MTGGPGALAGVTALDRTEAPPAPTALVAVTLNVYVVPLVSPLTVELVVVVVNPVHREHAGDGVRVYLVIGEPPFEAGALKVTVAVPSPALAATPVGTPGTLGTLAAPKAVVWPCVTVTAAALARVAALL